jgi:hypothetical protein
MTDLDALDEVLDAFVTHPAPQSSKRLRTFRKHTAGTFNGKRKVTPLWRRQLQTIKAGKARHGKAT